MCEYVVCIGGIEKAFVPYKTIYLYITANRTNRIREHEKLCLAGLIFKIFPFLKFPNIKPTEYRKRHPFLS